MWLDGRKCRQAGMAAGCRGSGVAEWTRRFAWTESSLPVAACDSPVMGRLALTAPDTGGGGTPERDHPVAATSAKPAFYGDCRRKGERAGTCGDIGTWRLVKDRVTTMGLTAASHILRGRSAAVACAQNFMVKLTTQAASQKRATTARHNAGQPANWTA